MEKSILTKIIIFVIVAILFVLCFFMLKPILISIILGLLVAYILHPLFIKINKVVKEKNIATIMLIILIIAVIFFIIWFFVPILLKQGFEIFSNLQKIDVGAKVAGKLSFLSSSHISSSISAGVNNLISTTFNSFLTALTKIVVDLPNLLLQFTVFIFVFYFSVRDSEKLSQYIARLSPFSIKTEKELVKEFRQITNTIVYGQVLIGVLQGLLLGLGLFILGVPNAFMLTIVAAVISIIPILGPWLIWLPIGLFLLVSGQVLSGIILILYGALFVSTIDNVLRFIFLSKKSRLNIPLSVIGLVAGFYTFGVLGLVIGPLILSYAVLFITFYKEERFHEISKDN